MADTCVQIVDGKRDGRNSNELLNGFRYSKRKINKNGSVIWSCRVLGCKCTLTSGADLNVIRNPCPDHTHITDIGSTAASLLVNNMRKRAKEDILVIPQIYEQERPKMLTTDLGAADIAQHLKLFNGVCSQLYRQRRYLIPQTPAAARDIRFGDEWCTTTTGDNFIIIDDITEGGFRIIVFGTLANLQCLCSSSVIPMDGTFKVCPRLFYQVYVIHSHCYNTVFPERFCLLPGKQTTYHRLFILLQSKCIDHQIALSSSTIIVDFEVAVHNVVRFVFSNSTLHGCLFHYGQALYGKLQELSLSSNRYSDHDAIMKWFSLFTGVAFVPSAPVSTAFALIKEHYTPNCRGCKEFNLHFFDTWLTGRYPVPI